MSATNGNGHTLYDKVLLAAGELDSAGYTRFTAAALAVAAWQRDHAAFGLEGYTDKYPDCNKVNTTVMGTKGLPRKGLLTKTGPKEYALTLEGRHALACLRGDRLPEAPPAFLVCVADSRTLGRLLDQGTPARASALAKFSGGRKDELTFADAGTFWGLTSAFKGDAVDDRLGEVEGFLRSMEDAAAQGDLELTGGRVVSAGDVRVLLRLHEFMLDRFQQHLRVLRTRK